MADQDDIEFIDHDALPESELLDPGRHLVDRRLRDHAGVAGIFDWPFNGPHLYGHFVIHFTAHWTVSSCFIFFRILGCAMIAKRSPSASPSRCSTDSRARLTGDKPNRSEEHTSELQSPCNLV